MEERKKTRKKVRELSYEFSFLINKAISLSHSLFGFSFASLPHIHTLHYLTLSLFTLFKSPSTQKMDELISANLVSKYKDSRARERETKGTTNRIQPLFRFNVIIIIPLCLKEDGADRTPPPCDDLEKKKKKKKRKKKKNLDGKEGERRRKRRRAFPK